MESPNNPPALDTETLTMYSAQRNGVIDKLLRRETHIQPWKDAAPYDVTMPAAWRRKHRRAYAWMVRQFKIRMGRPLPAAPVWCSFDYDVTAKLQEVFGRTEIERIVTLKVPRSEVLLAMQEPWMTSILDGWCLDETVPRIQMRLSCEHTGKERRKSWEQIFQLSDKPTEWQGIIDRIEPQWLWAIDGVPIQDRLRFTSEPSSMKKLDISDHRAVREYLTDEDYGLPGGKPYVPTGAISPESWASLTRLPDTVALMTTDGYTQAISTMQKIVSAWLDIHDAMPDQSPMQSQCLAALESFEGAIFNAVHGWYRIAGIAIRNAVEDVVVGLYYQNRPADKAEFEAVTTGKHRSPRRHDIDGELAKYASQALIDRVNALYQDELSIYVHRMSDGELWEGSNGPVFVTEQLEILIGQYERAFRLLCELIEVVVPGSGTVAIADAIQF